MIARSHPHFYDIGDITLALERGCVHVWRLSTASNDGLEECAVVLQREEIERASQFYWDRDRRAFMKSRAALRNLLASYTGQDPVRIRFQTGSHGKPFLDDSRFGDLRFNVSHSGDVALLAFALDCELGVDVELMRQDVDFASLAKSVFSDSECAALASCNLEERANLFYEYWACKEACIKADGRGLSVPLERFKIDRTNEVSPWREVVPDAPGILPRGLRVRIFDAGSGYAGAVAANFASFEILQLTFLADTLKRTMPQTARNSDGGAQNYSLQGAIKRPDGSMSCGSQHSV